MFIHSERASMKKKILIVEDYLLTRTILKKTVELNPKFSVCADFDNAEDAVEFVKYNSVDLVLMDIGLPNMSGVETSYVIKKLLPNVKIILLTSNNLDLELLSGLFACVDAYILKDIDFRQLNRVINSVLKGSYWVDSRVQYLVFYFIKSLSNQDYQYLKNVLNSTECMLISLVLNGFTERKVAKCLNLNLSDLSFYAYTIFKKISKTKCAEDAIRQLKYKFICA